MNPKTAIAIARVSSKEQADGYSIEAQKTPIREYCRKHDIKLLQIFEFYESAGKKDRHHFMEAIHTAIEQEVDIIAVEKTDRIYRNFRDYVLVEDLIEKHGIAIHLVKEGEVFDRNSTSHSKVIHGFKVLMAKAYLDNLSEEVKKGQQQKAKEGHYPGKSPFGYRKHQETGGHEPDPQTAPIVLKLFESYARKNRSLHDLTNWLNEQDIKTVRGGHFNCSSVYLLLTNPFYYGDFRYSKKQHSGKHTPLVTFDLWKKCQEVMQRENLPLKKQNYLFAGLLFNEHNKMFTGETHKGHIYYGARFPESGKKLYIREDKILETINKIMKQIQWTEIFTNRVRKLSKEIMTTEKRFLTGNVERIQGALGELHERKERLLALYLDGGLERGEYKERKYELEKSAAELERQLETHKKGDATFTRKIEELIEGFQEWPTKFLNGRSAARGAILRRLAARIKINKNQNITIEFKEPFALFVPEEIQKTAVSSDSESVRKCPLDWELLESNQ